MFLKRPQIWVACLLSVGWVSAQSITLEADHPDAKYHLGERVTWSLKLVDGLADASTRYVIKRDGLTEVSSGSIQFNNGMAQVQSTLNEPGSLLLDVTVPGVSKTRALDGVVFAPEKIKPSLPPPEDFDSFWSAKIKELSTVPIDLQLTPQDSGDPNVDYSLIRMGNIRGSHIYGQIARPRRAGEFPAMLIVQWAGVYPLTKGTVVGRAKQGFIALNISAHDAPSNEGEDYYKNLSATTLKDYVAIGQTDRESSYFLRMYLSCYRAVEYLAARDDWDGKTLVATGTSQGGLQAIVAGAINRKVTTIIANVPAGCDGTGHVIGRAFGWPYWHGRAKGEDAEKITQTSRYFDAMNFSPRVKCPTLISAGLVDMTCPISGVLAAYNQIQSSKEILLMIDADHQGQKETHAPFHRRSTQWIDAILQGQKLPPPEK